MEFFRALLCLPSREAVPILARYSPARLPVLSSATGEETKRLRQRVADALPPREGQAWSVGLQGAGDTVELSYIENEACLRSVRLRFAGGAWRVRSVGVACD